MSSQFDERAAARGISPLGGRPRKVPPPDAAQRIREAAADGWSVIGCASRLGVSKVTFANWLQEFSELREAFELGREHERHTLHNEAFRIATEAAAAKDRLMACMYLLNSRHNYRTDNAQDGARVNIAITLPGAMTAEQYRATLEHAALEHKVEVETP